MNSKIIYTHLKKTLILFLFLPFGILSQSWQWANSYGGGCSSFGERANSIFSDGMNFYLVGSYGCNLHLPGGSILSSNGYNDIFVAKFDPAGALLWAKTIGGSLNQPYALEDANGVYDPVNNCIYMGGSIIGTVNFPQGVTANADGGSPDVFVARMDLNGNFSWVRSFGSVGNSGFGGDIGKVFIEPDGDVLVTGELDGPAAIGPISLNKGGFFARYDSNGNCKWAANKFGPSRVGTRIGFVGDDMIMAGAYYYDSTYIDTVVLNNKGSYDGYISRLDSAGKVKWIKNFTGTGWDGITAIYVDQNSIMVGGDFRDTMELGGFQLINPSQDIFIAKLDFNGSVKWLKQNNASGSIEEPSSISAGPSGTFYIAGIFSGTISFGSNLISTTNSNDMFIARLDSVGDWIGVLNFGHATGKGTVVDQNGAVYCTGSFKNTVNIGTTSLTSYDSQDIFVAKLDAITGINSNTKLSQQNQLIIYANPNKGTFNIKVPEEVKDFDEAVLLVYDKQGKEVGKFSLDEKSTDKKNPFFDVSNSTAGTYVVKLVQKGKVFTGQLVLEE
jgi:hypothetical protein